MNRTNILPASILFAAIVFLPRLAVMETPHKSTTGQEEDTVTAISLITGVEGKEGQLRSELLSMERPTRAEPGCIRYELYQSLEKRNLFMRYEVWRSKQDLEAHRKMPYVHASTERRRASGLVKGPSQVTIWQRVPGLTRE